MILGSASGLTVVGAVATFDRHNHVLDCPHCGKVHSHGGFGPTSPRGAANGARYTHCNWKTRLDFDEFDPRSWYVLVEVPGQAKMYFPENGDRLVREVSYDRSAIANLSDYISDSITDYESRWLGPCRRRGNELPPDELAWRRRLIPWPSAYYGHGPVAPGIPRFPETEPRCALYWHYDANDVLLYIGITERLSTRGKAHARSSDWVQFAVRAEARWYLNRAEAETAERAAIEAEEPVFNRQHNDTPEARQRLVAYLVEHGRADLLASPPCMANLHNIRFRRF